MRLINVPIGSIDLTREPNRLVSVLGSCIGLAIFDAQCGLGGMAHILLPCSRGGQSPGMPGKYADIAVANLVTALLEHGARRANLRAKAAGGARMFERVAAGGTGDVGAQNTQAVRASLAGSGIALLSEDFGGYRGRKVCFDPASTVFVVETLEAATTI